MSEHVRNFLKSIKDPFTTIMDDEVSSGEFVGYIDTGSYALNAQISGTIHGGLPTNFITAFVGDSATGKTFFALELVRNFLDANPDGFVVYYDSETATNNEMMKSRGIDTTRVILAEPITVQEFRTHALNVLDAYEKEGENRPPMLMVLDSLGNLSTTKEVEDSAAGKETRDMTRAQVIKSIFRVMTKRLSRLQVPMVIVGHLYSIVGAYIPTKAVSGGTGLIYAATTIIELSKSKDKDGTEVVGVIIKAKANKARLAKENSEIKIRLNYSTGLDRYYGLLEIGEKAGLIKKVSTQYQFPDGTKAYGKNIYETPEKYFTPALLADLDTAAKEIFKYGGEYTSADDEEEEIEDVE